MSIFTALILGFLMILDPCTLMTSVAAIGYIDREITNRYRILVAGLMFSLGKIVTYILLTIPFLVGAQTDWIQSILAQYGEPIMGVFMLLCGAVLLISGHHHHEHDHGMSRWLKTVDDSSYPFWAFMLGIFFAIAFCPHRLIYFFMMVDITLSAHFPNMLISLLPAFIFGLGTALPILVLAWLIPYSSANIESIKQNMSKWEKYLRLACAILFIGVGIWLLSSILGIHMHHHV